MLQIGFWPSCMNWASVFEWHKRFKEGRESVWDYERCGRSKESIHESWLTKGLVLVLLCGGFRGVQEEILSEEASPLRIGSIFVTDYLTKMGIKTVPQPPYSPELAHCDFWLFSKLRGCRYETFEELKEAVTKVIDTLTQEDFHGAFQKLLKQSNSALQPEEITSKGTRVSCV